MAFTKIARPVSKRAARFGIGTFGQARFSKTDGFLKVAKPTSNYIKVAKPV